MNLRAYTATVARPGRCLAKSHLSENVKTRTVEQTKASLVHGHC